MEWPDRASFHVHLLKAPAIVRRARLAVLSDAPNDADGEQCLERFWGRHLAIVLLVLTYLALGLFYSLSTPIFEASDELWHYPFVKRIADGLGLPVQSVDAIGPWRQEGSQPPLYYSLAALLTFWIDTNDMESVRWLNPHADIGVSPVDRNVNMVIHPQRALFPPRGTALAVMLVRWASLLLGATTVLTTYLLSAELFPDDRLLALGAAGLTALNPMFLFISASVNNDNLVIALSALSLWLMVRFVGRGAPARHWLLLGILLGLGIISKESGMALLPLAALVGVVDARRHRSSKRLVQIGLLIAVPVLIIGGWWYWRNWRLYHDPLGLNLFVAIVGPRHPVPTVAQLLGEWKGFVMSFWGLFGGVNIVAPPWVYWLLSILGGLGLLAWPLYVRRSSSRARSGWQWVQLALVVVWPWLIFGALIRWTMMTMASQGRLMFPAISSLSVLTAMGLSGLWGRRWSAVGLGLMNGAMLFIAVLLPIVSITPAYRQPPSLSLDDLPSQVAPLEATFGGRMRLLGYQLEGEDLGPGETLLVTLFWRSLTPMTENYSVFVHLLDGNDSIVAQRDRYPGQGTYPTSLWPAGTVIADSYALSLPSTVLTPNALGLAVGLYHLETGERLEMFDPQGVLAGDSLKFGRITVPRRIEGGIPNPMKMNFDDEIALVGYALDRTSAGPGEAFRLDLYWRALRDVGTNYSVFTHVLGEQDRIWAQDDGWPQAGAAPTASWRRGQLIEDHYTLVVADEASPGTYELEIGLYAADGERLNLLGEGGYAQGTRVVLTRVRIIDAPPPEH